MPRIPALSLLLLGLAAIPAGAVSRGRCRVYGTGGPTCYILTGRVTFVDDGDTLDARIPGVGIRRIRITGIQAMEQSVYSRIPSKRRGQCHALPATARLNQLIRRAHGRVRIAGQSERSFSRGRPRRSVAARIDGRWVDVGRTLVAEGHVLWDPNQVEWAWNDEYSRLAQQAALRGRNLWNTKTCGAGPSQRAKLRVFVNWDAQGNDYENVDGEYVRVENLGGAGTVRLGHWWLRDNALRRFTFPSWAKVPAGGSVTMYVGRGRSSGSAFYWNLGAPAFENVTGPPRNMGDGAYLFDPRGDLRAWQMYPCRLGCADPLAGALRVTADWRGARSEDIRVTNASGGPLDLDGYVVKSSSNVYDLGRNHVVLGPGETLQLDVQGSPRDDTRLRRHWGLGPSLKDAGATAEVRSFSDVLVACYAWGAARCPAS